MSVGSSSGSEGSYDSREHDSHSESGVSRSSDRSGDSQQEENYDDSRRSLQSAEQEEEEEASQSTSRSDHSGGSDQAEETDQEEEEEERSRSSRSRSSRTGSDHSQQEEYTDDRGRSDRSRSSPSGGRSGSESRPSSRSRSPSRHSSQSENEEGEADERSQQSGGSDRSSKSGGDSHHSANSQQEESDEKSRSSQSSQSSRASGSRRSSRSGGSRSLQGEALPSEEEQEEEESRASSASRRSSRSDGSNRSATSDEKAEKEESERSGNDEDEDADEAEETSRAKSDYSEEEVSHARSKPSSVESSKILELYESTSNAAGMPKEFDRGDVNEPVGTVSDGKASAVVEAVADGPSISIVAAGPSISIGVENESIFAKSVSRKKDFDSDGDSDDDSDDSDDSDVKKKSKTPEMDQMAAVAVEQKVDFPGKQHKLPREANEPSAPEMPDPPPVEVRSDEVEATDHFSEKEKPVVQGRKPDPDARAPPAENSVVPMKKPDPDESSPDKIPPPSEEEPAVHEMEPNPDDATETKQNDDSAPETAQSTDAGDLQRGTPPPSPSTNSLVQPVEGVKPEGGDNENNQSNIALPSESKSEQTIDVAMPAVPTMLSDPLTDENPTTTPITHISTDEQTQAMNTPEQAQPRYDQLAVKPPSDSKDWWERGTYAKTDTQPYKFIPVTKESKTRPKKTKSGLDAELEEKILKRKSLHDDGKDNFSFKKDKDEGKEIIAMAQELKIKMEIRHKISEPNGVPSSQVTEDHGSEKPSSIVTSLAKNLEERNLPASTIRSVHSSSTAITVETGFTATPFDVPGTSQGQSTAERKVPIDGGDPEHGEEIITEESIIEVDELILKDDVTTTEAGHVIDDNAASTASPNIDMSQSSQVVEIPAEFHESFLMDVMAYAEEQEAMEFSWVEEVEVTEHGQEDVEVVEEEELTEVEEVLSDDTEAIEVLEEDEEDVTSTAEGEKTCTERVVPTPHPQKGTEDKRRSEEDFPDDEVSTNFIPDFDANFDIPFDEIEDIRARRLSRLYNLPKEPPTAAPHEASNESAENDKPKDSPASLSDSSAEQSAKSPGKGSTLATPAKSHSSRSSSNGSNNRKETADESKFKRSKSNDSRRLEKPKESETSKQSLLPEDLEVADYPLDSASSDSDGIDDLLENVKAYRTRLRVLASQSDVALPEDEEPGVNGIATNQKIVTLFSMHKVDWTLARTKTAIERLVLMAESTRGSIPTEIDWVHRSVNRSQEKLENLRTIMANK